MNDFDAKNLMEYLWDCGARYFSPVINKPTVSEIMTWLDRDTEYYHKHNMTHDGEHPFSQRLSNIIFCSFKDIPLNLSKETERRAKDIYQCIITWRLREGI